jgi:hypothetical protein
MLPNTELQDRIWYFILQFYEDWGFSPLRREIAAGLSISPQLVQYHLYNLESAGKIYFNPKKNRNIIIGRKPIAELLKISND